MLLIVLFFAYLSTEDNGVGAAMALSVSLFIVATGVAVVWPVGVSSISSGQPNASFVFPYLNKVKE